MRPTSICAECRKKHAEEGRDGTARLCDSRSHRNEHRLTTHRPPAIATPPPPASRRQMPVVGSNNSNRNIMFRNSSIVLLGLLTCAAVLVQAFASSAAASSQPSAAGAGGGSTNGLSPWGTARGGAANAVGGRRKREGGGQPLRHLPSSSSSSSTLLPARDDGADDADGRSDVSDGDVDVGRPTGVRPLNGMEVVLPSSASASVVAINGVARAPPSLLAVNGKKARSKKTILTPGGFSDTFVPATYVAETNLPTSYGHFRIRAYRIEDDGRDSEPNPLGAGAGLGSEPCVIYCTDKPPFGAGGTGEDRVVGMGGGGGVGGARDVPMRIHDQCFTSEVFGSQR